MKPVPKVFVVTAASPTQHRQLPSDEVDRCHYDRIVRVKHFDSNRFAFDVVHAGFDAPSNAPVRRWAQAGDEGAQPVMSFSTWPTRRLHYARSPVS